MSADQKHGATLPETETQQAIREQWCNGCRQPRAEWGPVCPCMYVGDWTHYHSPEFWLYRQVHPADDRGCSRPGGLVADIVIVPDSFTPADRGPYPVVAGEGDPGATSAVRHQGEAGTAQESAVLPQEPGTARQPGGGLESPPSAALKRCGYCGLLGWTVAEFGRLMHKHGCPHRSDEFCQAHPLGCARYIPTPLITRDPGDECGCEAC